MQTLFLQGPSVTLRMIILVVVSIVLMTIDHRWNHLEIVRSTLSHVLYPLQYTIDLPIRLYEWTDKTLSTQQTLLKENKSLLDQQLQNRVSLQKLDILEKENSRLRELLSATPKVKEKILIAEILTVDTNPYRQLIILNKSASDGVYLGQPIIDAEGVMGQIKYVNSLSATAILITDASHALPVQVDRTGLRSIAFGTGQSGLLELRHITHSSDLQIGDKLITSGLGGKFPPNYPVAIITDIERPSGEAFATVKAKPMALLDKSREVLLVWHNPPEISSSKTEDDDDQ